MAKHNSHRASGRAVTPAASAHRAARGFGGAAVLGTVLVGTAFAGSSAQAAPTTATTAPAVSSAASTAATNTVGAASTAAEAATTVSSKALNSTSKLRFGSRGDAVSELQTALNENGASLVVDGVFGSKTNAAVRSYQSSAGLAVDGVVGPNTRAALNGGTSASAASSSSSSSTSSGSAIVDRARSAIGTPYVWAGSSLSGFDCSGLVQYAYEAAGISLPHQSGSIANGGRWISQSEAQPGDIVAYSGHVAIYAGNGKIIDASRSKSQVVERSIWGSPIGFVTYR